mmetsp:Transcript_22635/g.40310  ORF Transcript_22635/g.40310 Transcript_22635/m.40310 type:complete len:473 (-) Transcript_22635:351-1769(-)
MFQLAPPHSGTYLADGSGATDAIEAGDTGGALGGHLPAGRHSFSARVKMYHRFAVHWQVALERASPAGEAEVGQGHRNGHVDSDHADINFILKLTRRDPVLREYGGAVAMYIIVRQRDGFVQCIDLHAHQHGAEDLLQIALHVRLHARNDGRAQKVAVRKVRHLYVATVEQQRGPLFDSGLDESISAHLRFGTNHRTHVSALDVAGTHAQSAGFFNKQFLILAHTAHKNGGGNGHAALTRRAEGGPRQRIRYSVAMCVRHHDGVILGAHIGLHTLSVGAPLLVDIAPGCVRTHEGDGLDVGVIQDAVYGVVRAMDDVEDALRQSRLQSQLGQHHSRAGVLLRRLQHHRVSSSNRQWEHPERDHGWKVERADAAGDSEGLSQRKGVDPGGHVLERLPLHEVSRSARLLHHLQPTKNITARVPQCLALLQRDVGSQLVGMFADQVLQVEHNTLTDTDGGIAPRRKRRLCGRHRG